MNRLEGFKERKRYIIQDLLRSMTYAPNREIDIDSMMQSYLSAKRPIPDKDKEILLKNLANCINGLSYDPPPASRCLYTRSQVDELASLMDAFIDQMEAGCAYGHLPAVPTLGKKMWEAIDRLNEKAGGTLMSSRNTEEINNWISGAREASVQDALDIKNNESGMQML